MRKLVLGAACCLSLLTLARADDGAMQHPMQTGDMQHDGMKHEAMKDDGMKHDAMQQGGMQHGAMHSGSTAKHAKKGSEGKGKMQAEGMKTGEADAKEGGGKM